jgi:hypothetical protein
VYLDTNIWIDFTQERTTLAGETLRLARLAQDTRRAIFPISYPAAFELLNQGVTPSTQHQARLMDELSERVSFRAIHHIREMEVIYAYEYLMDGVGRELREKIFTAAAWYGGDGHWEYPDGWNEEDAAACTQILNKELPGLEWEQERLSRTEFETTYRKIDDDWVTAVSALDQEALRRFVNADGTPSASKLRLEEYAHVIQAYFLKILPRRVGFAATALALEKGAESIGRGGPATTRRLIELMPSIWLSCEMHVRRRLERNRLPRPQDLYDHDHAMIGIPYCDVFVTGDGELLDLVGKCGVQRRYTCQLVHGMDELRDYLQQVLSVAS